MLLGQSVENAPVPAWSGLFWQHDEFGYISVAYGDDRQHRPPSGWSLVKSMFEDDAEVFLYRQVCDECYNCADCGGCDSSRLSSPYT